MNVFDMPVIGDERMVENIVRWPKTKKKRIRKKCASYRYKSVPRKDAFIYAGGIVCHPSILEIVKQGIEVAKSHQPENQEITKNESV